MGILDLLVCWRFPSSFKWQVMEGSNSKSFSDGELQYSQSQPPWGTNQEVWSEGDGDGWCDNGFLKHVYGVVNCLSQGVGVPSAGGSSSSPSDSHLLGHS